MATADYKPERCTAPGRTWASEPFIYIIYPLPVYAVREMGLLFLCRLHTCIYYYDKTQRERQNRFTHTWLLP